ncbi:MAG: helicase-related protein [Fibrobacterales bacterium]
MIEVGNIVKNLDINESVKIIDIKNLGTMKSVSYIGVNSQRNSSKVLDQATFDSLEIIGNDKEHHFTGDPTKFKLYAEAERINSAYQFDPLFAVNCSIVDPLPHQVEAVYRYLLPLPQIRFLLADDTGAGKTIMAGLLIKELMMRGLVERILIITPGGLTKQWQEDEMGLKFNIPFKLVNRAVFNSDPTIFSNSNKIVTSIDFLRGEDVMNVLESTRWDMIIVDEAHKLSAFEYGKKKYVSKRYEAIHKMSLLTEHLLLLTATPHRGRKDTFRNLLQLLDEDIFSSDSMVTSRVKEVGEEGVNKFFIRRLKEQMKDWDGKPLFKPRHTKTTCYELTEDEKLLYKEVTSYLTRKRKQAVEKQNIHVELTLMVMQRRLTSSIYAINKTLNNRYKALKGLLEELTNNPALLKKKLKFDFDMNNIDDYDELSDDEREALEEIISDPRKAKLFTTANDLKEIREEVAEVKVLVELADSLLGKDEQKVIKVRNLMKSQGVLENDEKIVIFTEHKDTLIYLENTFTQDGYTVETIHGGKSVDQRRQAQFNFANKAQILLATDAAGEGINLQFCRLLINWDIPWNPNRLEQRMGRIHRYGQEKEVIVFNLVAQNTREGMVLEKLLKKLDLIRDQLGDDRVYDVISDIFEGVNLQDVVNSTFEGTATEYDAYIESKFTKENVSIKIDEQKDSLGHSNVDYSGARLLKENSDEKRLQPIYVKLFFEKALESLGGKYEEVRPSIYKIIELPSDIVRLLSRNYNVSTEIADVLFCFDKKVFLNYQSSADLGCVHYINPGNPVFDSVVQVVLDSYREEMVKGTVLVSPEDKSEYFAYFIKSQITDNRPSFSHVSIADERLGLVSQVAGEYALTSPAKFLDLHAPVEFAKKIDAPLLDITDEILAWSFQNITQPQFNDSKEKVKKDAHKRKEYLETAFTHIIMDMNDKINELQGKVLYGDKKAGEKIVHFQERIEELNKRKFDRIKQLDQMMQLEMCPPEVLGCAYVVPLSQVEYNSHYGMSRDDEVEEIAMNIAMEYEIKNGWEPKDVSLNNEGYDIRSVNSESIKRYIEVKGRSADGGIMVSENEMNRLSQLGETAWLYIVIHCKSTPELFRIQNPAKNLKFEQKSKGIQYFVGMGEWRTKV